MSGIFISYRHDDSGAETQRLWDRLAARLGADRVFMDIVTLQPGTDFAEAIDEKVGFCDALVAVIGPGWLESVDAGGRRRLDDPQDWVRLEIAAALSRGIKVIPALVGGATLPGAMQLPAPVAALASYQAIELRPGRFEEDVERLGAALQRVLVGGNAAVIWLALLARRHRALDPLDLHKPEVLWRALRFLLLMIVVGEILRLPAAARAGLEYWDIGYVAAYALSGCVEWLALGVALHLAMRACGGRAAVQKSIAVLCFLSAWLPLIALSQAPVWGLNVSVLTDMADVGWSPAAAVQKLTGFVGGLGIYGTVRLVVSFVAATTLWLILFTSVFAAFRTLHRLDRGRAVAAFGLGLVGYVAFIALFYAPLLGSVYHAFGIPPR
jgi:hypothetical protein